MLEEGEDGEYHLQLYVLLASSLLTSSLSLLPSPSHCLFDSLFTTSQFIGGYHICEDVARVYREVTCSRRHSYSLLHHLYLKGYVTYIEGRGESGRGGKGGGKEEEEENK